MKLQLDSNGFVTGFATQGGIENSVEYTGEVPQGFYEDCQWYKLANGTLVHDISKKQSDERKAAAIIRIDELKELLSESDYIAVKYAEGYIAKEEYETTKIKRQNWRDEINRLRDLV